MLRKINKSEGHQVKNSPVILFLLIILSSFLSAAPFINGKFWLAAWFGYVPLFWLLENRTAVRSFILAYLSGIFFWLITIYWLVHVTALGLLAVVIYLSLYFGIFGLLLRFFLSRKSWFSLLAIPALWVVLEYLRSYLFTGFPWALLGYSQYSRLGIIQIADITGVWGVSFLVMMGNVAAYQLLRYVQSVIKKGKSILPPKASAFVFIFLVCLCLGYGYYKLLPKAQCRTAKTQRVVVIQGNIPQRLKWDPRARDYIVNKYLRLTEDSLKMNPDLIIWPEAALPVVAEEDPEYLDKIKSAVKQMDTPVLLGAVTRRDDLYYNSAVFISEHGELSGLYDKIHLVPFGEFIPLRKTFPFLETIAPIGDITPGRDYKVFSFGRQPTAKSAFSVLICFEDLFPELSRRFVASGAVFLVNITNDAWYMKTTAAFQHMQASVFRAVENRVYLARSANTGVSCIIDPSGRIVSEVVGDKGEKIFIDGFCGYKICSLGRGVSFYNRHGDFLITICIIIFIAGIILIRKESSS